MPKIDRLIEAFGNQKQVKKIITTLLVVSGLGGVTLVSSPVHRHAAVAVGQRPTVDPVANAAAVRPEPAGDTAPGAAAANIRTPVTVTKDSGPLDIVKAIVSQGQTARLSEDQIKAVIATAKIESTFRPTVSGGVQAYEGGGAAANEVIGLFQEKASFGTVAERQDPNKSITRFIARFTEAFRKYGISSDSVLAATLAQNPQLVRYHGGVGTDYYNTVRAAMSSAADLYYQVAGAAVPSAA
ncbi:hypothetical protein BOO86_00840 [Mycobacterium sp. CBMA 234]|uniref:hypothetical protein n=1 Tax=Mycolicibacterium sp. CBMA 234 TaxID=1918495 RepID=UPI0012DCAA80|nr:hypothetical protein [Mycolicibacterium sp. CBMA 234]MUL62994.1 hypothetical protein [Mycolicibacterium sp. CBMA 234]